MKIVKKGKKGKGKVNLEETAEELSYYEKESIIEELCCREAERDCIFEGDITDDKDIISRTKLFQRRQGNRIEEEEVVALSMGDGLPQLDNAAEYIAYIPCYEGGNSVTAVKKDGQAVLINKSIKSVIKKLLMESSINTYYLRKVFKECFGGTNLMPLPLGLGIVLVPVKVRKTIGVNDGSFAYIDLAYIKDVIENKETIIKLKCGFDISCIESVKTVRSRMKAAKLIEEKISLRFIRGQNYKEGLSDIYSEYDKAATKGDITMLAYEIMKLRDKLEQG